MARVKKPTQCERILKYIADFGSITDLEAYVDLGIRRLASRIHDLRSLGYPIIGVFEHGKNRYGEKTHYKRYSMGGESNG
jgi:hypothetical protein